MDCTYLNDTKNLRLFLHNEFYTRPEILQQINELIPMYFDVFNINYSETFHSFKIKIKKTNMKKNDNSYTHDTSYYYKLVNCIFCTLFNNNIILIQQLLNENQIKYMFSENIIHYLLNPDSIFGIYNVTTLLDNILVINL